MPKYQLLVSDMDSTVAAGETIVDMADALGIGPKIAEITERSMRGELDFRQALEERVMMLRGLELSTIQHIAKEVGLSDGAHELLRACRAAAKSCCSWLMVMQVMFTPTFFTAYSANPPQPQPISST